METKFVPRKGKGLITCFILIVILLSSSLYLLVNASRFPQSPFFLYYLTIGVLFAILTLPVLFRVYELATLEYILSRSSLEIRWGLRDELLPMQDIDWLRPASDFEAKLPIPFLNLPGWVFGKRVIPGLGKAEFAATDIGQLILIAAGKRWFVISPRNAGEFARQYVRSSELGSLEHITAKSQSFASLWRKAWQDRTRKRLFILGSLAGVLLWVTAITIISLTPSVTWVGLEVVPSARLLLLPVLGTLIWIFDLALGVFLHLRGKVEDLLIHLLWASSFLTSLILIAGMILMAI